MYGFSGSFLNLLARSSCFTESKALLESIAKKANCFTNYLGYPIKVAVDPTLNWQERISTVSTFSVGKLSGAEVAFNGLTGMAVVHNFLESL